MMSRCLLPLLAAVISGCATAPSVIDAKNDPSSPSAAEGSTMVHPLSLTTDAPGTTGMQDQKPSGDKMKGMAMPGMNMQGMDMNSTKSDQNKGDISK